MVFYSLILDGLPAFTVLSLLYVGRNTGVVFKLIMKWPQNMVRSFNLGPLSVSGDMPYKFQLGEWVLLIGSLLLWLMTWYVQCPLKIPCFL